MRNPDRPRIEGYTAPHPVDVYRECLRDAEEGELSSTLANMETLKAEEFEHLLKVAEQALQKRGE